MVKRLVFLVGASGVGKTTVARLLGGRPHWSGRISSIDDCEVPAAPATVNLDSDEARQGWATDHFVAEALATNEPILLLDAQTRPSLINAALSEAPSVESVIILLDCSIEVRAHRLVELRQSPELANPKMDCWAAYLCGQAHALGLPIIDTSWLSIAEVAERVEALALQGFDRGSL